MDQVEQLLNQNRALLRRLCKAQMANREDIEDLESEVILTVCQRFTSFDPSRGVFGTWLGTIVRNEAHDLRRRATRQPVCVPNSPATERLIEHVPDSRSAPFEDEAEEIELPAMPNLFREAFSLVKLEGKSCAEAAETMGRSVGSVRTYVWRAKRLLRSAAAVA
jgi:RNA polymerase sigma-70 factor (ECF subfamily)